MATQNDGRIPGGPTTEAIKHERESHISSLVFAGSRYDYPDVRLREHGIWRQSWELTAGQKALVEAFGFHHVDAIRIKRHDRDLILSIVERWWPTRNTFQLPFGEMTITLADVAEILGLPIDGHPIYFDENIDASDLIRKYLGVEPPSDIGHYSTVKLSWLRDTFMQVDRIGDTMVSVDDSRVICCTRAYLLCLCGSFLFPDSTGNKINVRLLPFFDDLGTYTQHAWGAATLAYLYHSMTSFVSKVADGKTAKNISGCLTLIQFWCYEHLDIGRPVSQHTDERQVLPGGLRWNTVNVDYQHCIYQVVSIYRHQLDTLTAFDVEWHPLSVPRDVTLGARSQSLHRYYIMYNGHIMFHPADRVMRQFGLKQIIPLEPLTSSRSRANMDSRVRTFLLGWYSRFTTHGIEHMSELMTSRAHVEGNEDYIRWYGCPLIQNRRYVYEEPRFQARALDDRSLRERSGRVDLIADQLTEMSQVPGGDPTGMLRTTARYLSEPLGPPFIPLDIPDDQPAGIVRQRHARPRRTRDRGASSSKSRAHPRPDGEGTSQAYEGVSQPYVGVSQPYAGMSHPYEGVSHPYEGVSQPYFGRSYPYEDTSQSGEGTSHGTESTPQATPYIFDSNYYVQMTGDMLFGPPQLDPSTQLNLTPHAPQPSQIEEEAPEGTGTRRDRLGLRRVDRRNYRRDDRGR